MGPSQVMNTLGKKLQGCLGKAELRGKVLGSLLVYNDFGKFLEILPLKTEFTGTSY